MAAPTPVSALVHSSTLVTAGVYLIIRFFNIFRDRVGGNSVLFNIAIFTIFIAGIAANFEYDFKKIIALSTLRQLGFIIIILRSGFKLIAIYHLLIHAIFKSLLFISAGVIIHSIKNIQDIRLLGNLNEIMPFTMIRFIISSIALTGTPFISGFYRKDLIMELVYSKNEVNIYIEILVIISLFLTVLYSVRLLYYLIYIFFFDFYIVYLSIKVKLITLGIYLLGGIVGIIIVINIKKYLKLYYLGYFVRSI
ncbi:PREDICTED: NADH-ubiquinone oxidoreductase chain 5-like [Cyphomyrmex costatus]|uniref:NADH-ubiquinone oxidoreductase chain 5-like n=1 Tax=Cyphomyrmex costatus TaxID=456900 RepID=UPI0008522E1A|nr:PREDICTED: NADH-ubiquinone oxidoreductase chain 5-like [Cyphomyrmex costatus]